MKKIYICGDSFAVPDPEYGPCWVDLLADLLADTAEIKNLAIIGSSNLTIALQINEAIKNKPDFVIYLATSAARLESAFSQDRSRDLYSRLCAGDIRGYSIAALDYENNTSGFNEQQKKLARDYHSEFYDLDLAIFRDRIIINHCVHSLMSTGRAFIFDPGGYEHPMFGGSTVRFPEYAAFSSAICLWDNVSSRNFRPYYHIQDPQRHREIAQYFLNVILNRI